MKEITQDLEVQKQEKAKEFEENQDLRKKIQELINHYKKEEEIYKQNMEKH